MIFCTLGASGVEFVNLLHVWRVRRRNRIFSIVGVSGVEFVLFGIARSSTGTVALRAVPVSRSGKGIASRHFIVPKQYRYCFAPFLRPEAVQVQFLIVI
jgi:hypothetical protein